MRKNLVTRHPNWRQPPLRTPPVKEKNEKSATIIEIIKDQLVILGSLVLAVGIISTHSYYATFGIKYQTLDLPTFHIVYHGLLILVDAPYLLIPYFIAVAWVCFDSYASTRSWSKFIMLRIPLTYALILGLFVVTFPLARLAGTKQADEDLHQQTSKLPRIVNMQLADGTKYGFGDGYRLLEADSTYTTVFKPLDFGDTSTLPNIKRFSKGQINVIETLR